MDYLLEKGKKVLKDNCIITGGHFRIFFNKEGLSGSINRGTLYSFEAAVRLFKFARKKGLSSDIGLLINDMGSACDEDGCPIKPLSFSRDAFSLPDNYIDILNDNGLDQKEIIIYWEKHIRNKSKKAFLRKIKGKCQDIIKGREGYFLKAPGPYLKVILTRTLRKDKYGVPACPLIMGGLLKVQSDTYDQSINYYYIGQDNHENIPNHFVLEKARPVGDFLGADIEMENIYFEKTRKD
jgi:hypothetical protein